MNIKKIISILLIVAALLPCFASCNSSERLPKETPEPGESGSPAESSGTPDQGENGTLGDATVTPEPDKKKPENPEKTLFQKSKEQYSNGNIGCTGLTLLAEYNNGVDFDIKSYKDYDNKIYYLFLPCRADLSSVTFTVTHRNGTESGPYTADFSDGEVSENEKVIGSVSTYGIIVMQSELPSVMLEIDETYVTVDEMNGDADHETYAFGSMVATVTDGMAAENGWATRYESKDEDADSYCSMKVRGRGNATWGYSKKPYHVVVENPIDLFGMGRSKKYVFLANYRDASGLRTQLALEMGQLTGIEYTSEHRQVDLFMNGEYLGMYTVAEKTEVGINRVEIDQEKDILFEKDNYAKNEEIYGFQTEYTNERERGFRIHSPEDASTLSQSKTRLIIAERTLFDNNDYFFEQYFDLDSWARMYLLQLYSMNSDAYYGSLYFYYNGDDGKMYACSPWDFDWSFGVSWGSTDFYTDPMQYDIEHIDWIKPMLKHENFIIAVLDAYYKGGVKETIEKMPELVDKYGKENRASALMNEVVNEPHYFPESVTDYDGTVTYVRDICVKRAEYIDQKMEQFALAYGYDIED